MTQESNTNTLRKTIDQVPTICIIGDSGAGKTSLASTWPNAYCVDLEGGGGLVYDRDHRVNIDIGPTMLSDTKRILSEILKCKYDPAAQCYDYNGVAVGAVVLDSQDALQQVTKTETIQGRKTPYGNNLTARMETQDWGTLLDVMLPIVYLLKKMRVPQIVVSHIKVTKPVYARDGETLRTPGRREFAAQGQYEDQAKRWFDYILHLRLNADGTREIFHQPCIYEDYEITAKDRYRAFQGKKNPANIPANDFGYPTVNILKLIHDIHVY